MSLDIKSQGAGADLERSLRGWRIVAFVTFMTSSALFAVTDYVLYDFEWWTDISWVIDTIIAIVAITAWCYLDAQLRGHLISRRLGLWIILAALFAVPVYLVQSRGWKGALKVGLGLPFFALSIWGYDLAWTATVSVCEWMQW